MFEQKKMNAQKWIISFLLLFITMSFQAQDLKPFFDENEMKFGFKNQNGKVVIEPRYDYAIKFQGNLAGVGLNRKYGFIDKTGKEIIPLDYDRINSFSEGMACISLYPQSMFNIGYLFVRQNKRSEAFEWLEKTKTAGHPQAENVIKQLKNGDK